MLGQTGPGNVRLEYTVIVLHSMNQIARNLDDLRQLVKTLNGKRIRVEFIKEHLTFKGDDSPVAALLLSVMGGLCGIWTGSDSRTAE